MLRGYQVWCKAECDEQVGTSIVCGTAEEAWANDICTLLQEEYKDMEFFVVKLTDEENPFSKIQH